MPISGVIPFAVQFTDASSSNVTAWLWDFGDGTTSTSQNPTHTFSVAGTYVVTLFVTGVYGTAQFSDTVTAGASSGSGYIQPTPSISTGVPLPEPEVMLRLSNDGGRTWTCEMIRTTGKRGEYWRRVRWNRLGCARRRVFEVSVSDPIPWRIVGAYVESQETERP